MAFDFTGWAALPGIDTIRENIETVITWGPWEYNKAFIVPTDLDGAARDQGASPTTLLRAGLLLGMNRTTLKCKQWNPAATDGTQDLFGVLLWDSLTQKLGVNQDRWFGFALVGGLVKSSSLIFDAASSTPGISGKAQEHFIRGVMAGRYTLDDFYHQWNGSPLMGGWKNIQHKTADYTVVAADNGTLFTNLGDADAIEFTLPAITSSKGQRYGFYVAADQNLKVSSAAAGDLIWFNDTSCDSVSFETTSEKVGGMFEVIGLDNNSWIVITHLAADSQTVTVVSA